jgi:hypothetical protein
VFLPVFVVAAVVFFTTRAGSSGWTIGGHRPPTVDAEIQTAAALVGALSGLISAATGLLLAISKFTEIRQRRRSRAARRNAGTHPLALKAIGRSGDDRCPTCHGTGTVSGPDLGPYRQRVACIACMGTGWLHITTANVEEVTTAIAANVGEVTTAIAANVGEVTTAIAANVGEVTTPIAANVGEVTTPIAANVGEVTTPIAANVEEVTTVIKVHPKSADEETHRLTGSSSE